MQLLILLAVLLCVMLGEVAPAEPALHPLRGVMLVALSVAATVLAARLIARRTIISLQALPPSDHDARRRILARFERAQVVHAIAWIAISTAAMQFGQWPRIVRYNLPLGSAILIDDLLILAPLLGSLLAAWAMFHGVDKYLTSTAACGTTTLQAVSLRVRHFLTLPLLPLLLLLGAEDSCRFLAPANNEIMLATIMAPLLVLLVAFFPLLLRVVWTTRPLARGPLRERLDRLAQDRNVVPRQVLVWHTGRQCINAAVVGFLPGWRYVLLSDALVERFSDEQIAAIFAHELAHVSRRHMLKRAIVLLLPIALWQCAGSLFPGAIAAAVRSLAACGLEPNLQSAVMFPLAMAGYFVTVFAPFSQLLEHEADLAACQEAGAFSASSKRFSPLAVEQLSLVLEAIGAGCGSRTPSLLHPTVERRVGLLRQCLADPKAGDCLDQRAALASRLSLSLAAGALAAAWVPSWTLWEGL
jgi:STE24 endopeptidase